MKFCLDSLKLVKNEVLKNFRQIINIVLSGSAISWRTAAVCVRDRRHSGEAHGMRHDHYGRCHLRRLLCRWLYCEIARYVFLLSEIGTRFCSIKMPPQKIAFISLTIIYFRTFVMIHHQQISRVLKLKHEQMSFKFFFCSLKMYLFRLWSACSLRPQLPRADSEHGRHPHALHFRQHRH